MVYIGIGKSRDAFAVGHLTTLPSCSKLCPRWFVYMECDSLIAVVQSEAGLGDGLHGYYVLLRCSAGDKDVVRR